VQEHWANEEIRYIASLIDIKEGDVTHRTTVGDRCSARLCLQLPLDADIDPDGTLVALRSAGFAGRGDDVSTTNRE